MDNIQKAANILNQGGIVIFPTDTAFGIGCRIDKVNSIEKLFKIRKRPLNQPTPILASDLNMVKEYVLDISEDIIEKLIRPYWPGAVTIVFNAKNNKIPDLVRGGTDSIGIRIPNHETMLELIRKTGVPILGPSANFHSDKTPYAYEDLDKELVNQVDFVLKGDCSVKKASTVIDVTHKPWQVLRQGAIKITID